MSSRAHWKIWILRSLHFLMALSVPLVLTAMLSCMKATAQKEDLGPAVPVETINAALARVEAKGSVNNLAIGQYLIFDDTRRVENGDTELELGARKIEVIDRQDTTAQARFTMRLVNSVRLPDSTFETTVSEDALWLDKVSAASVAPLGLKPVTGAFPINPKSLAHLKDGSTDPTQPTVSFYHLQESDGIMPASPTLAAKPNCGGIPNCELPIHIIHFDIVTWADSDNYNKVTIDFGFSTLTPLIPVGSNFDQLSGLLVENCQSSYVTVDDRSVYVRDCSTLEDFQK